MSDTINIGGITVSKFYLGGSSDVKIYLGTTKLYPHLQEPCFAVVDNISTYTARTYVDVYETSSDKWYKLNNLSAYEEYGVYGSSTATTYYDGKLVIQDNYEYQYSGSSWVNVGEVSGSSITIKSPEYIQRDSSHTGYCALLEYMTQDTKIIMKHRQTNGGGYAIIGDYYKTDSDDWRVFFTSSMLYYDFISQRKSVGKTIPMSVAEDWEIGNYYIKNITTSSTIITGNTQSFSTRPNQMYLYYLANAGSGSDYGEIYYIKIYRNDVLIRDFIPWTDMNGNYGLYDKVENQLVQTTGQMTASTVINDVEVGGGVEYPLYYLVKQDPPSSVTFSSMTEAEAYECPYVGLDAYINGTDYIFDANYSWVTKYGLFEVSGAYICDRGNKYQKMEEKMRNVDDTWSSQNPPVYEKGELIESASTDCQSPIPSSYTELQYLILPSNGSYAATPFYIKNKMNVGYEYSISFTPLDWETNSYYKNILGGNDEGDSFGQILLYSLDNGWGDIYKRTMSYFYNYDLSTWNYGSDLKGKYAFHDNSKSIVTFSLSGLTKGNGATLIVENEGYETFSGNSTGTTGPVVTDNVEYDMALFTRKQGDTNGAVRVPYCNFYFYRVKNSLNNNEDIYYYVPVIRNSDNKVGLYEVVNGVFYYPSNFNFAAGPTV